MQLTGIFLISMALFQQQAMAADQKRHLGETCRTNSDCVWNDYCKEVPGAYGVKRCAQRIGGGANCTADFQCFQPLFFCSKDTKVCEDYRHLGESCNEKTKCAAGLACCKDTKKCAVQGDLKKAEKGQACSKSSDCAPALFCSKDKKCARRGFWGAKCTANDQCRSYLFCSSEKKCMRFKELGQKCLKGTAICLASLTCGKDNKCAKKA